MGDGEGVSEDAVGAAVEVELDMLENGAHGLRGGACGPGENGLEEDGCGGRGRSGRGRGGGREQCTVRRRWWSVVGDSVVN